MKDVDILHCHQKIVESKSMVMTLRKFVLLAEHKKNGTPRLLGFADTVEAALAMKDWAVKAGEKGIAVYQQFDSPQST